MSVQSKQEKDKLILTLDNGDLREFNNVMDKWSFKDHQSLMRFAVSLLVLNENKHFSIRVDNQDREVKPASNLVSEGDNGSIQ